jgi:hypothetical protein
MLTVTLQSIIGVSFNPFNLIPEKFIDLFRNFRLAKGCRGWNETGQFFPRVQEIPLWHDEYPRAGFGLDLNLTFQNDLIKRPSFNR